MKSLDRFDWIIFTFIAVLVSATGLIVAHGSQIELKVNRFTPTQNEVTPLSTDIQVIFDVAVSKSSVEERFSISPPTSGVTRCEKNTLIFEPQDPLIPGKEYIVIVRKGAKGLNGETLKQDTRWSFKVRLPFVYYLTPSTEGNHSLWRFSLESQQTEQVATSGYGIESFAASPDGQSLAATIYLGDDLLSEIWAVDFDGGNPRQLISCNPDSCKAPVWSPDGGFIAFERQTLTESGAFSQSRIWLYNIASKQLAPIFQDTQVLGYRPVWSPNSTHLAFYDRNRSAFQIIDISKSEITSVTSLLAEGGGFSPDERYFVYTDLYQVPDVAGNIYASRLMLADLKNENKAVPLLVESADDQYPVWSPDGKWITFGRSRTDVPNARDHQLMLYNVETKELRPITTDNTIDNYGFQWDPSSRFILMQRVDLKASFPTVQVWLYDLLSQTLNLVTADGYSANWQP